MKKILFIIFFFSIISFQVKAKDEIKLPTDEKGNIIYTEVVEVPNVGKDELFSRASEWLAKTYKSSKEVIQMQDKDAGKIVGKGVLQVNVKRILRYSAGWVNYTISLFFKEGKYKYEFSNFYHEGQLSDPKIGDGGAFENEKPACGNPFFGGGMTKGEWRRIKEQADAEVNLIIIDLKNFMIGKGQTNDNW